MTNVREYVKYIVATILVLPVSFVSAQDTTDKSGAKSRDNGISVAEAATDPSAILAQLGFLYWTNTPNSSGATNAANSVGDTFLIQPVLPLTKNNVLRPALPLIRTPDQNGDTGIGDLFVLDAWIFQAKNASWGIGPAVSLPTASQDNMGTGKYEVGPSALYMYKGVPKSLFGILGYNLTSVAGDSNRADVNKLFAGPVLNYHFADLFGQKGWYLRYTDQLWSFDWEAEADRDTVSIPVGAALGKVFSIGKQPVNVYLGGDYYAAHRGTDPVWDIKLNVTLLFPE